MAMMHVLWRGVYRPLPSLSQVAIMRAPLHQAATAAAAAAAPNEKETTLKSVREIPGPRTFPWIGCLPSMIAMSIKHRPENFHKIFESLIEKYGPMVRMENPQFPPAVVVIKPEHCEAVIRATMDNPLRIGFLSLQKIRLDAVDNYFEGKTGLLIENGEEWWRVRSRVQTSMMKPKNVSSYLSQVDEVSLEFVNRMAALQAQYGEMPRNFQTELYKWALESVGLVALSRRMGCLRPDLTDDSEPMRLIGLVNDLFHSMNKTEFGLHLWRLFPSRAFRTLREKHNEFLNLADSNIRETEAALLAQDKDDERESTLMEQLLMTPGLSRKDVVTLILDMLFAGIDTTSHTIGFTLYLLARHPEVQARLQDEVDTVLQGHKGPLTSHHIAQLSYLKAVIKESLRVFPLTLGVGRTLDKDLVLDNYLIPKDWTVIAFTMSTSKDEGVFPQANKFIPERWLRHKPLGPIHPFASLPFGAGTRMCIGRRLAEQEMYILLTRVMQRFTVDYKYEDIGIITNLVFSPSRPLRFNLTERR